MRRLVYTLVVAKSKAAVRAKSGSKAAAGKSKSRERVERVERAARKRRFKPAAALAASVAATTKPARPVPLQTQLIRSLYHSVPAEKWELILSTQKADTPGGKLLALMHDPAFANMSLERRCAEAGIDFKELVRLVSDHSLGQAIIESTRHTAEIVTSIAEDAKNRLMLCDMCLGLHADDDTSGEGPTVIVVDHPRMPGTKLTLECPKCIGMGRVRKSGDARARETFLKLHGALEEAPQAVLQNTMQVNFGSGHAQSVHRGQQLLEQGRRSRPVTTREPIIEAEVVPPTTDTLQNEDSHA